MEEKIPQIVERLIDRQQARTKAYMELSRILSEFPDLINELLEYMKAEGKSVGTSDTNKADKRTSYERAVAAFVREGNEWMDTAALTKSAGVQRNQLATVLWSTHKGDFEQRAHPTHKRMKQWRLRAEAFSREAHLSRTDGI